MNLIWFVLLAGLFAHSTLLWFHFSRMWEAEHFQFFPAAIVAAGALLYSRRSEIVGQTTSSNFTSVIISLSLILIVVFFATILQLAWVGWVCFLAFLLTLVYATYGWGGVRGAFPAFIVLAVIKPLPSFSLEQIVTIRMQHVASGLASWLLDSVGVIHSLEGVVLKLPERTFLTEDGCSGIRSLFSSITAVVFIGMLNRFHWFRQVLNILQTIFWVVVFNALRIATVIFVEDRTGISVASGWQHEVLGFVAFFLIFVTVLSTDCFFSAIVLPAEKHAEQSAAGLPSSCWQWLKWNGSSGWAVCLSLAFALIGVLSIRLLFMIPPDEVFAERMQPPKRDYLAAQIGPWKVASFEHIHRPDRDLQGADSYVWQLVDDRREILISLDGTFNDFHDLEWCYSGLGWQCKQERSYQSPAGRLAPNSEIDTSSDDAQGDLCKLELSKATGERGIVFFSAVDRQGRDVIPQPGLGSETAAFVSGAVFKALRFAVGLPSSPEIRATTFVPPVSTIQLMYKPSDSPSDAKLTELTELKQLFLTARQQLRQSPRFKP
jgi:exosortase